MYRSGSSASTQSNPVNLALVSIKEKWQKREYGKIPSVRIQCVAAGSEKWVSLCKDQREASRSSGQVPGDTSKGKGPLVT